MTETGAASAGPSTSYRDGSIQKTGAESLFRHDNIAVLGVRRSIEAMRSVHLPWVVPLIATPSGCSSVYDIRATVIDGTLAFVADTNLFGNPDCVRSITVEAVDGPPAAPNPGDDASAVKRGVYWQQIFASPSCENLFPVKYGARLSGPLFIFADGGASSVQAKSLIRGVT